LALRRAYWHARDREEKPHAPADPASVIRFIGLRTKLCRNKHQ